MSALSRGRGVGAREAMDSISWGAGMRQNGLRTWLVVALVGLLGTLAALGQEARDAWQRPAEVLDALGVGEGSVVADIGCGQGYFTAHLARRVGPTGLVYAVDIDEDALAAVERLAARNDLRQVRITHSEPDDPRLPDESLDVALIVDTYHEFHQPEAMLERIFGALKPGGRLGIIDRESEAGELRSYYLRRHRIPKQLVQEEVARHGFRFVHEADGFQRPRGSISLYFLIFEKPGAAN